MSIRLFLKFGSKQNMQKLFENGEVYFSNLEDFRVVKNSKNRDDNLEGTLSLKHFSKEDKYILKINPNSNDEISFKINKALIRERLTDITAKVLSLYSIEHDDVFRKDFKIDKRILEDENYEYCVMITNPKEFIDRLLFKLNEKNIEYKGKPVSYLNYNLDNTSLDLFTKSDKFNFQKEYRIILYGEDSNTVKINIGSINDIAVIYKTEKIKGLTID